VCLTLSIMLSSTAPANQGALVFASVFVVVWCGAAMVTLNAQLLGGGISFFQSVCVLGYCVFPLTVASAVCLIVSAFHAPFFVKAIIVVVGFLWSTRGEFTLVTTVFAKACGTPQPY
jgi:protein YIPF6